MKPERGLFFYFYTMKEKYRTGDITLAAVILSVTSAHLISVERKDGEAIFTFWKSDVPEEVITAYNKGDLRIEPVAYSMVFRFLVFKVRDSEKKSE